MKVKVLFFGIAHDVTGFNQELVEVREGERLVDLLGRLEIGETSVTIIVTSAHRQAAFEACHEAINRLKRTVPIWKKEYFEDGGVWAEGSSLGEEAEGVPSEARPKAEIEVPGKA